MDELEGRYVVVRIRHDGSRHVVFRADGTASYYSIHHAERARDAIRSIFQDADFVVADAKDYALELILREING